MHKGIIEPSFDDCCSVWGSGGINELDKLRK